MNNKAPSEPRRRRISTSSELSRVNGGYSRMKEDLVQAIQTLMQEVRDTRAITANWGTDEPAIYRSACICQCLPNRPGTSPRP